MKVEKVHYLIDQTIPDNRDNSFCKVPNVVRLKLTEQLFIDVIRRELVRVMVDLVFYFDFY